MTILLYNDLIFVSTTKGKSLKLKNMRAKNITFEITNLTTKEGFIFRTIQNVDFDKAYKMIKKEFKNEIILIENVKINY
jgi:hypothetical protein